VWRARFSPLGASLFMLSTARVADGRGPRERRGHARTAGYSSDRGGHGWVGPDARERGEAGWWLGGWVGDSDQSRSGADRWGEGLAVHWSVELDGEDESCRVADMPAAGGQHELGLRYDWAANCRVGGAAQVSRRWARQILCLPPPERGSSAPPSAIHVSMRGAVWLFSKR